MKLYSVQYNEYDLHVFFGVFSSRELAEKVIENNKEQYRYPECFEIIESDLNVEINESF